LFLCLLLEFGVLAGFPMQLRELGELLRQRHQPNVADVLPSEGDVGSDPLSQRDYFEPK